MAKFNYLDYRPTSPGKPEKGTPEYYAQQYSSARSNLLVVTVLTLINVITFALQGNYYLLFSAAIPYYLPVTATAFDYVLESGSLLTSVAYVISGISIALYALSWLLSKQRSGWLVFALVLFVLDFLGLAAYIWLFEALVDSILDILFHILILCYLVNGIRCSGKLRKAVAELPPEPSVYTGPELDRAP